MTKLLIFDWDGTLSDSLSRIAYCLRCAAIDNQLTPPSEDEAREIVGLGLEEALRRLFPKISDDRGLIARLRNSYSEHFLLNDAQPSPLYPYVMESLTEFRDNGHFIAVATGKSRRGLDRVLREKGLDGFFHASRCADETRSKPHPQMLHELVAHFGVEPEQAVMVGDTEFDMAMAQSINMPRLAVSYGAHARERLQRYQPLACVDCFSEVGAAIGG